MKISIVPFLISLTVTKQFFSLHSTFRISYSRLIIRQLHSNTIKEESLNNKKQNGVKYRKKTYISIFPKYNN
ncbi:hypothetical protein AFV6_gp21 [Betalipothrixvirus pozzuoliense]|uniref:Uncharacterized protein n=1 Tax=Betalipothrixvirus pozzuoliense TaxID=346882 RepID=A7WKH5_9VIRU|nr:hypothetical protein AFV6_gp21 [Acidianus filamentous virus 6]CAJ31575.1 hypothetical protein [Acidianus filamentous virus 6]